MSATKNNNLDIQQIMEILPHRYPFLLVDKIHSVDTKNNVISAQKNVTMNEEFFQGHFPGAPIMPGVLILEALAQAGGVLIYLKGGGESTEYYALLMNVKNAKFRKPVYPGDVLMLDCEGIHFSSKGGKIKGVATVDGELAVEAEMGFALVKRDQF
ncbi:MAG: 3-hydroxyacyl-ACP dehydratase FabZ [Chlamydiota bacterium]|nr:3-hydroxyacyl-ACP dehydratase FabZ [Chlamydiota bacterium]